MHCWARYLLVLTVVALGATSIMGACGRKGPLYLPKDQDAAAPHQQQHASGTSDVPVPAATTPSPGPTRP